VLPMFIVMVLIVGIAGLVLAYCAYPHRGQAMPKTPWIGEAMERAVDAAPTLDKTAKEHAADPERTRAP